MVANRLNHSPRTRSLGWCVVALVFLSAAGGLIYLAPEMAPVKRGSAAMFWQSACGTPGPDDPGVLIGTEAYPPRNGWFIYERGNLHGSELYRVPDNEVTAYLDAMLPELDDRAQPDQLPPFCKQGYEKWRQDAHEPGTAATDLVTCLQEAKSATYEAMGPDACARRSQDMEYFEKRMAQARWYWANLAFEWALFSGIALVAMWPLIRGSRPLRWAVHFGLIPILFLLPVYLGYAKCAAYTTARPGGGALYPWLVAYVPGHAIGIDRRILTYVPQILEPLSQPTDPGLSLSGRDFPGPSRAVIAGLITAAAGFALGRHEKTHPTRPATTNDVC